MKNTYKLCNYFLIRACSSFISVIQRNYFVRYFHTADRAFFTSYLVINLYKALHLIQLARNVEFY